MGNRKGLEKKLTFNEWFLLQHGERPSAKEIYELEQEAFDADFEASLARNTLNACQDWDSKYTSALYAWQAKQAQDQMRKRK